MKKIVIIISSILLFSCSKDDDGLVVAGGSSSDNLTSKIKTETITQNQDLSNSITTRYFYKDNLLSKEVYTKNLTPYDSTFFEYDANDRLSYAFEAVPNSSALDTIAWFTYNTFDQITKIKRKVSDTIIAELFYTYNNSKLTELFSDYKQLGTSKHQLTSDIYGNITELKEIESNSIIVQQENQNKSFYTYDASKNPIQWLYKKKQILIYEFHSTNNLLTHNGFLGNKKVFTAVSVITYNENRTPSFIKTTDSQNRETLITFEYY